MKIAAISVLFLSALPASPASAQSPIGRGSIQIAGTAGLTHTEDIGNDFGFTTLEILPRVGYFVVKGLAINGNLRFRRVWFDDIATLKDQTFTEWGIGPGLTYYVSTRSPRFFPFASARAIFVRARQDALANGPPGSQLPENPERGAESSTSSWLVSAGGLYMLGTNVGVSGELFYQRNRATARSFSSSEESSNSAANYGIQWGIAAFIF